MNPKDSKKLYAFAILEILKKYSTETHPLSQNDIIQLIWDNYQIKIERKSIRRNIEDLNEILEHLGQPKILWGNNNSESAKRDYFNHIYYPKVMSDSKLTLLISTLLSANNISTNEKVALANALRDLGSASMESYHRYIATNSESRQFNFDLFHNISLLNEAISANKKVQLFYLIYNDKKELVTKISAKTGKPSFSTISPYYIVTKSEKLYLLCSSFNRDTGKYQISHYRIDRISSLSITDEPRTPIRDVEGMGPHFNLNQYLDEHIDMLTSPTITTTFIANKWLLGEVMDTFGGNADIISVSPNGYTIKVRTARRPFLRWASKFATDVIIQSPKDLVEAFKSRTELTMKNYKENVINTPDEKFDY